MRLLDRTDLQGESPCDCQKQELSRGRLGSKPGRLLLFYCLRATDQHHRNELELRVRNARTARLIGCTLSLTLGACIGWRQRGFEPYDIH
jgi:hypothetical protein